MRNVPEVIKTEFGEATIGVVRSVNAIKPFLCPLCDECLEIGEEHVVAVPLVVPRLRRHIHTECLLAWIDQELDVKLHPFNPNIIHEYM